MARNATGKTRGETRNKRLSDRADHPDWPREIDAYRRGAKERLRSKRRRPARAPAGKRLLTANN